MSDGIVFQVETTRILQILAREIYDSPLALVRENLQNAYDAVRMRFAVNGALTAGGRIEIIVENGLISILDNGIGMTESVLRENFWKAGSSGKHSDEARRAGVVGTFGIGAMANFGVCTRLLVETRPLGKREVLRSVAERAALKIGQECITLQRIASTREVGTTVTAELDSVHQIGAPQVKKYLEPYVALLPVPVYLNGELISQNAIASRLPIAGRQFTELGKARWNNNLFATDCDVRADTNGQIVIFLSNIAMAGNQVEGEVALVQGGGQLMGLRSFFGLAPIPAVGPYQLGGFANLSFLQPTAGREALSRESIEHTCQLVNIAEWAASDMLAKSALADKNNSLLQWIMTHNQLSLANRVAIRTLPEDADVPLGEVQANVGSRSVHYYAGTDRHILTTFANESACLLHVVQANPRRNVQLRYLREILKIEQVPDSVQITKTYDGPELTAREASILLRIANIVREDYLIANVEPLLAEISHSVSVYPQKEGEKLKLYISRSGPLLPPLFEFYDNAVELFAQFMKDFVRVHIYPHIQQFVPSSTRDGVEVLRKILERNRELYRYEEAEMGDFEGVLGEYLSGKIGFADVLQQAHSRARPQSQSVSQHQVGSVESEVPGVVDSPVVAQDLSDDAKYTASPPIIRDAIESNMKILVTTERYSQLNGFKVLLGLSDRLMLTELEFFRTPHTTRILWGGHRVIYIFTEATGRLSLYYDISLREPIEQSQAGGGMFQTTTLITKSRVFVPVPEALTEAFKIAKGSKEFYVRFDVVSSDVI